MLPDFLGAIGQRTGSAGQGVVKAMYSTAEDVIEMWETVEEAATKVPRVALTSLTVTFDDKVQGKDNAHYWLYVSSGIRNGTPVGSLAVDQDDHRDYSKPVTVALDVSNPISLTEFDAVGGSVILNFYAQLGGLHQSSDWKTDVTLTYQFADGSTRTVQTSVPIALHGDMGSLPSGGPKETWTGSFKSPVRTILGSVREGGF